jgi:hypothetical protein
MNASSQAAIHQSWQALKKPVKVQRNQLSAQNHPPKSNALNLPQKEVLRKEIGP